MSLPLRPLAPLVLSILVPLAACGAAMDLYQPTPEQLEAPAPDSFEVLFRTSAGQWRAVFHRSWSPEGADRIYQLAENDFWAGARFYRVNPRVVQFGYSGNPALDSVWRELSITDDPVVVPNDRGRISFARGGPDSRTFQLFINRIDNGVTDDPDVDPERFNYDSCCNGGYPPVGEIRSGIEAFDAINSEYGESPRQDSIRRVGSPYLMRAFPRLDSIIETRVTERWR